MKITTYDEAKIWLKDLSDKPKAVSIAIKCAEIAEKYVREKDKIIANNAINAAKKWLENQTSENEIIAYKAAEITAKAAIATTAYMVSRSISYSVAYAIYAATYATAYAAYAAAITTNTKIIDAATYAVAYTIDAVDIIDKVDIRTKIKELI